LNISAVRGGIVWVGLVELAVADIVGRCFGGLGYKDNYINWVNRLIYKNNFF
jgi:hypothetical protein